VGRIVDLIGALADGFALRHAVDPARAGEDAFADAAVGLLRGLTDPVETA
jgi:hypothetical protein